ncbi:3-oxoacyl-[acyl-carrier-protein] synthase 3 [Striga asiatica]|uniref:3-oxoacyl-[acyl-carrier-protein] synthase 3 n=1 Tax=Striga asiatica TaxID=4170 RepID=A0A5A7Q6U8_STRAF|nr:3-oxoacyl-[acyl-carrier-protein] synthase 3 [Striga asiatica]
MLDRQGCFLQSFEICSMTKENIQLWSCKVVRSTGAFARSVSAFTLSSSSKIDLFAWFMGTQHLRTTVLRRVITIGIKSDLAEVHKIEKNLSDKFPELGFGLSFFLERQHFGNDFLRGRLAPSQHIVQRCHVDVALRQDFAGLRHCDIHFLRKKRESQ